MEEIALFVVPVLATIFVFALLKTWLDHRAQARSDRVKLLEEALKNPAVDRPTIESLAFQLTGAKNPRRPSSGRLMALILGFGWMALFVGIGMWVLAAWVNERDLLAAGVVTSIAGFGLVTYPFALRELEARRVQS